MATIHKFIAIKHSTSFVSILHLEDYLVIDRINFMISLMDVFVQIKKLWEISCLLIAADEDIKMAINIRLHQIVVCTVWPLSLTFVVGNQKYLKLMFHYLNNHFSW